MAGNPAMHRTQVAFLGFHDPSGATGPLIGADDVSGYIPDFFGAPFRVRKLFLHVVENQSAHTETVTLKWRPTPGSATGSVTIGTYVVPASVTAGQRLSVDFNENNVSATTIGAGGHTSAYGIAGSASQAAGANSPIVGPGGEFLLEDSGSSTAGQYNIWAEVEILSNANSSAQSLTVTALDVTS